MSIHRQTYLDELTRWCGRGDFITSEQCSDCIARGHPTPSSGRYRCHECFQPDLTCQSCCLKRHKTHPFHRIEVGHLFLHCSNTYICVLDVDRRCVRQGVLEINGIEGTTQSRQYVLRESRSLPHQYARSPYKWYPRSGDSILWLSASSTSASPAPSTPALSCIANRGEDLRDFRTSAPTPHALIYNQSFIVRFLSSTREAHYQHWNRHSEVSISRANAYDASVASSQDAQVGWTRECR